MEPKEHPPITKALKKTAEDSECRNKKRKSLTLVRSDAVARRVPEGREPPDIMSFRQVCLHE